MPRPLRIQYAGARYHVMSRGDRRERIFYDDADCQGVFEDLRPGASKDRLASSCLLSDGESFSSCLGDAAGDSGRGNEMVAGNLYPAVQSAASALGTSFRRSCRAIENGQSKLYLEFAEQCR